MQGLGLAPGFVGTLVILAPWENLGTAHLIEALLCLAASASYGASYVYMGRYVSTTGLPRSSCPPDSSPPPQDG